jgi:predicted ester cyclase
MDAPPIGAAVTFSGINIFRVSCGKVVEAWSEMSMLHLHRQLGLLPPTATPAT